MKRMGAVRLVRLLLELKYAWEDGNRMHQGGCFDCDREDRWAEMRENRGAKYCLIECYKVYGCFVVMHTL